MQYNNNASNQRDPIYTCALVFTFLPVEAAILECDVGGVTAGHVLLHDPHDSVEPPVSTFVI
jgi:hypothetical protein